MRLWTKSSSAIRTDTDSYLDGKHTLSHKCEKQCSFMMYRIGLGYVRCDCHGFFFFFGSTSKQVDFESSSGDSYTVLVNII